MQQGVVYTNAHYQHANTETIVGDATLATGAFPSEHGMIGNVWFDREAGGLAYNVEDSKHLLIPTRETDTKGEQVDPAQKLCAPPLRQKRDMRFSARTVKPSVTIPIGVYATLGHKPG